MWACDFMRRFVLVLVGLVLVLGVVGAVQKSMDFPGTTMSGEYVESTASFLEGWNLIWGFPNPEWLSGAELIPKNIKAIYALYPGTNEYVRFYPNPELEKIKDSNFRWDTYTNIGAFLVYSDKQAIREEYWTMNPAPLDVVQLRSGWNFIGITPEFNGLSMNEIKGDCDIIKAGGFDTATNNWDIMTESQMDQKAFVENSIFEPGRGIVVKVSSDCTLGGSGGGVSPPGLPGDETTDTYIIKENLGGYSYVSIRDETPNCDFKDVLDELNDIENCRASIFGYYSSPYSGNNDGVVLINHFKYNIDNTFFINYVKGEYGSGVEERVLSGNNVLLSYTSDSNEKTTVIFWYSNDKMILVGSGPFELSASDDPLIAGLLYPYLEKYPSDLIF